MKAAPPRRTARRVLLAIALLAGTLLAVEIALRFIVADWSWVDTIEFQRPVPPCFAMKPHSEGRYEGWWTKVPATQIRINSQGLRDDEHAPRAAAGVLRVAALGDSHVFGLGTEVVDGIPRRLASALRAKTKRPIEVLNAGVPGYDLGKEIELLPRVLDAYAPEKLLFFLDGGDLDEVPCAFWKDRVRPLPRYSLIARALYVLIFKTMNSPQPPGGVDDRYLRFGRELERLRALLRVKAPAVQLAIVKLREWTEGFVASPDMERRFDEQVHKAGFTLISAADVFAKLKAEPQRFVITGEGHLNPAGIEQLSAVVAERLVAAGFIGPALAGGSR